jgi:phosphatidylserine/phosphatidylglycerophosphate/cardiolipin synthase-like enzyme
VIISGRRRALPGRLKELASELRNLGGGFADGEGHVWGLSDPSTKQGTVVARNWVRYLQSPDLWEDDTTEFWRAADAKPAETPDLPSIDDSALPDLIDESAPAVDPTGSLEPTGGDGPSLLIDQSLLARLSLMDLPSLEEESLRTVPIFDITGKSTHRALGLSSPSMGSGSAPVEFLSKGTSVPSRRVAESSALTYTPVPWKLGATNARMQKIIDKRGGFAKLREAWCDIVRSSTMLVDVTSLEVPHPQSTVAKDLIDAIADAVRKAQGVLVVRLFFGGTPQSATTAFKDALAAALRGKAQSGTVHVLFGCDYRGVAGRAWKFVGKSRTWNHAKIVAGDGWRAITGGHNMNAEGSYTVAPVIHDLSCEVVGHGAQTAHDFVSSLWEKGRSTEFLDGYAYDWDTQRFIAIRPQDFEVALKQVEAVKEFRADLINQPPPKGAEYAKADAVLGVGRWGDVVANKVTGTGVTPGSTIPGSHGLQYCSDYAKRWLIASALKSICVSQQDLVSGAWKGLLGSRDAAHDGCHALAQRLAKKPTIAIDIVVSARYAQDSGGAPYSYGNSPRLARDVIASFAGKNIPVGNVCTVAPLVFCRAAGVERGNYIWPDAWRGFKGFYQGHVMQSYGDVVTWGFGPGNHAKALMTDDELVLIGSDNMYPSPLAEFSFIIEGNEAAAKFREEYWDKLWKYSRRMGLKVDHNAKVDAMDPLADFAALKKNAGSARKELETKLKGKTDDGFKLVAAVSILEQIEKAASLLGCYLALRFLPPTTDLKGVLAAEMFEFVYGEYLRAGYLGGKSSALEVPEPSAPAAQPWKEIHGVKLTSLHKAMLNSEAEWLDDRAIDAYVATLEAGGNVLRRFEVPVGRFVAAGGVVPPALHLPRPTPREVQVLNLNGIHWILAVRFPNESLQAAYVYDSLGAQDGQLSDPVKTFVRRCFGMAGGHPVTRLPGPRQPQGWECGPYACKAIDLLASTAATVAAARLALGAARFDNRLIRQAMSLAMGA